MNYQPGKSPSWILNTIWYFIRFILFKCIIRNIILIKLTYDKKINIIIIMCYAMSVHIFTTIQSSVKKDALITNSVLVFFNRLILCFLWTFFNLIYLHWKQKRIVRYSTITIKTCKINAGNDPSYLSSLSNHIIFNRYKKKYLC